MLIPSSGFLPADSKASRVISIVLGVQPDIAIAVSMIVSVFILLLTIGCMMVGLLD